MVEAEHAVDLQRAHRVRDVHVPLHVAAALPLVHVQPGSGRHHDVRMEKVHPRVGAVPPAEVLCMHVLIRYGKRGVVGAARVIHKFHAVALELVTEGVEHVPVALVVAEYHEGDVLFVSLLRHPAAGKDKAKLEERAPCGEGASCGEADEQAEQHGSRAGVDV